MTRGERLKNPLNIRITDQHWLGKITPSADHDFEQFDTPEHGIRAAAKILLTYFDEGIDTITGIITRWAPPSENPTAAYISNVCDRSGFEPDAPLRLDTLADLHPVIAGMIDQECGSCPYTDEQITHACQMALGTT